MADTPAPAAPEVAPAPAAPAAVDPTAVLKQAADLLTEALPHLAATLKGAELAERVKAVLGV
jgi:hypothetical protein